MKIGGVTITVNNGNANPFPTEDHLTRWTERQVRGSEKGAVIGSWIGAVVPALFAAFVCWRAGGIFFAKHIPNPVAALAALFSLGFLIKAIWETVRLRRFGDPMLELNTAPVPLGGQLEGRIALPAGVTQAPDFTVTLACIHRVMTQGAKNNSTTEKVLWSGEAKSTLLLGGILPISCAVPADQPQTNRANPFDGIVWRLTVKAPFRSQAFLEKYEVPIGTAPATSESL